MQTRAIKFTELLSFQWLWEEIQAGLEWKILRGHVCAISTGMDDFAAGALLNNGSGPFNPVHAIGPDEIGQKQLNFRPLFGPRSPSGGAFARLQHPSNKFNGLLEAKNN